MQAKMNEKTCFECASVADHDHHVVPRSRGGTQTVLLCASCHGLVHEFQLSITVLLRPLLIYI